MNRLGAAFWLSMLALAAAFAGAAWAVGNRQELRDGWRAWQVRRQPGYPALRGRWQKIALATEMLRWPDQKTFCFEWSGASGRKRAWNGPRDMFDDLERHVVLDEAGAAADFGQSCALPLKGRDQLGDDRAFAAVLALRAAGRISAGTYERTMLALARNGENPVHWQDAEALPVGALVLCDLVSDGGPRSRERPAGSLEEAIARAAGTRTAAAIRESWRLQLRDAVRIKRLTAQVKYLQALRRLGTYRPAPPYEALAFRCLAAVGSATGRASRACNSRPPERADPGRGWPEAGLPSSPEEALKPLDWPGPDHAAMLRILRREGEALPIPLRPRFWAVVRLLSENMVLRQAMDELPELCQSDPEWPEGPDYSPTLRLIAEILGAGE